jgi:pyruvate,water dikinase
MNTDSAQGRYIRWFNEIGIDDVALVGGKNASLGEMVRELAPRGIKVPNGFAVTAEAYWHLLRAAKIEPQIKEILSSLDTRDTSNLQQRGSAVRHAVMAAPLPQDLQHAIVSAYR